MKRIRPVLQLAETDCGPACLAMVSEALGGPGSLRFWRAALDVGRDGTSISQLLRSSAQHGLTGRAFRIGPDIAAAIRTSPLPAIVHVDGNHFVVVYAIKKRYVHLVDPRSGKLRLTLSRLAEWITGPLIIFERTGEPVRDPGELSAASLRGLVARSMRGIRAQLAMAAIVVALATVLPPALVFWITRIVLLRPDNAQGLAPLLIAACACIGAQFLGMLVQSALLLRLQARLDVRLVSAFVENLLGKRLSFVERRASGDIMPRIASSVTLRATLSSLLMAIFLYLPVSLCYLGTMYVISVPLALVATAGALLQGALVYIFGRRTEEAQRAALRSDSSLQITSADTVSNFGTIKAMGLERGIAQRWLRSFCDSVAAELRSDSEMQIMQISNRAVQAILPMALVLAGVILYTNAIVSLSRVFAELMLTGVFLATETRVVGGAQSVFVLRAHLERIYDLVADAAGAGATSSGSPSSPPTPVLQQRRVHGGAELLLKDVSYRYSKDEADVLRCVSLQVAPGESVSIGGPSGGGKTTLLNILLGLYEPTGGSATCLWPPVTGGSSPVNVPPAAYIPQEPGLFSGTIRDNVAAWREEISDAAIWHALELAALGTDVQQMPFGLNTSIGHRGIRLSGGQRQRLAIARALVTPCALLVADEPTSHLDPATESHIAMMLSGLACTRVIVCHEPIEMMQCNRRVMLDRGQLTEVGPGMPGRGGEDAGAASSELLNGTGHPRCALNPAKGFTS